MLKSNYYRLVEINLDYNFNKSYQTESSETNTYCIGHSLIYRQESFVHNTKQCYVLFYLSKTNLGKVTNQTKASISILLQRSK